MEPLRDFLRRHFQLSDKVDLADDVALLTTVIDRRGVIEVADFVEEAYGIRLSREDLLDYTDNFHSVRTIAALIDRKRAERS